MNRHQFWGTINVYCMIFANRFWYILLHLLLTFLTNKLNLVASVVDHGLHHAEEQPFRWAECLNMSPGEFYKVGQAAPLKQFPIFDTHPKLNIAPKLGPSQKDHSLSTMQGLCQFSGKYIGQYLVLLHNCIWTCHLGLFRPQQFTVHGRYAKCIQMYKYKSLRLVVPQVVLA